MIPMAVPAVYRPEVHRSRVDLRQVYLRNKVLHRLSVPMVVVRRSELRQVVEGGSLLIPRAGRLREAIQRVGLRSYLCLLVVMCSGLVARVARQRLAGTIVCDI